MRGNRFWSPATVLLPIACAVGAAYAAGSHSASHGLAAYFTPEVLATRFSQGLVTTLQKEAVAASLGHADVIGKAEPIMSKAGDPVDRWLILTTIASAITGDAARGRLASRLASSMNPDRVSNAVRIVASAPRLDPQNVLATLGVTEATVAMHLRDWLDTELPNLAIDGAYLTNGAMPPAAGTPTNVRDHLRALLSDRVVLSALTKTVQSDLDSTSVDAALAPLAVRDFGARAAWSVSATVFASLACASIFLGYQWCAVNSLWWARTALGAGIVAGAAMLAAPYFGWELRPPLLARPFGRYAGLYGLRIEEATIILNAMAAMAIVLLQASAWSGGARVSTGERLRQRLEALRGSMNLATALLVAGVFEIYTVSRWAGAFAATEAGRTAADSVAIAAAAAVGMLFSIMLILLYVPGVATLKNAGKQLVSTQRITQEQLDAMITSAGVSDSGWAQFQRIAQVLLPLAVSAPIAGIVEILSR